MPVNPSHNFRSNKSANSQGSARLPIIGAAVLIATGAVLGISLNKKHHSTYGVSGQVLRVGYQKSGILNLTRTRGELDKKLAALGVKTEWISFPAGPQITEALAVGGIDAGWTGDAPVVFALATKSDIVYAANSAPDKDGLARAVIVKESSPIRQIYDLRGKRVAVQKGSGSHNLLVQALEKAGIPYTDIKPVYLAPVDGRAAFEGGSVDAWVIWDPFLAGEQKRLKTRSIADGKDTVTPGGFYLSTRKYARAHPDLLRALLAAAEDTTRWAQQNPHQAAEELAKQASLDVDSLETTIRRLHSPAVSFAEAGPVTDEVIAAQQKVADEFLRIGLLPQRVDARKGLLTAGEYTALRIPANGEASVKVGQIQKP